MSDRPSPPPFVIGQKYFDRTSEYTVIAADGNRVTIERPDGDRRKIGDIALKARIHRAVMLERHADEQGVRPFRSRRSGEVTRRRWEMIERILQLESDGATHTGIEIDRLLARARDVRYSGYSDDDVSKLHPTTGRSLFANDGDWAKAKMTEFLLHDVVDTTVHWEKGKRRQCKVYRITQIGLDELAQCASESCEHLENP